eukprot:GHVS01051610.1.p1 GENE.GHVS01051610.1~~GHVS01051610.1.p1  ORF type:complete len:267 (+),score=69.06 GHVS01051610.1:252-1052(+)
MATAFQKAVKEWVESQQDEAVDLGVDGINSESLVLDGKTVTKLTEQDTTFLAKFTKLRCLSCIQTGLLSVKALPSLPGLHVLDLSDNRIAGDLNHLVAMCPNLTTLNIGGNKLDDIAKLESLKELSSLEHLCVEMNPLADPVTYRATIFEMVPQLMSIDALDKEGKEVDEKEDADDYDEEEDDAQDTTLKDFYTKDYLGGDEEEEEEAEFAPEGEEEDEEISDQDEDLDEPMASSSPSAPGKRSSSQIQEEGAAKKTRTTDSTNGA